MWWRCDPKCERISEMKLEKDKEAKARKRLNDCTVHERRKQHKGKFYADQNIEEAVFFCLHFLGLQTGRGIGIKIYRDLKGTKGRFGKSNDNRAAAPRPKNRRQLFEWKISLEKHVSLLGEQIKQIQIANQYKIWI